MKKILSLILAALMLLLAVPAVFAADAPLLIASAPAKSTVSAQDAALALNQLGLLAGKGTNSDGSINFALEDGLTRAESIIQVVRFNGAENAAKTETHENPFTDLVEWQIPYISYAKANGITAGVSATKFDPDSKMKDYGFLTAILRLLGYKDSEGDFFWETPYELAKSTGLISSSAADESFTRGDAFIICYNALTATVKSGDNIAKQLITKGVFTEEKFNEVMGIEEEPITPVVPTEPVTELLSIKDLNKNSERGDHASDDIATASLEVNFRENVDLRSSNTGYTRYDNAWYPRIKKVKDDLYVMFFMYGQFGRHLYWTYSKDSLNWAAPEVFWGADNSKKFIHESGPLEGKEDQYLAVNADACVLDNGDILCVYAIRPSSGYGHGEYADLNGIYMRRGTVSDDNKITWSDEERIYTGHVWEPFIFQRENGQIEVYWSSAVAYITMYGFDSVKRSTCTAMIVSNDNGETWTPDIQPGDQNNYVATRVFQEYVGDKIPYGTNEDGTPKYTEAVRYYGGQMPSVTELYNGKLLLAAEVHAIKDSAEEDDDFHISLGMSEAGGQWKELGLHETNSNGAAFSGEGAAPYLAHFESGEVYLTYTKSARLRGRFISPDGTKVDGKEFYAVPDAVGSWGSSEVVGSHEVISTNPNKQDGIYGISINHSYLNHRINAPKTAVSVDAYTNEWTNNTDALFVGSETQAQITLRAAHDNDNVYFLISRLDMYLTDGDTTTICIAAGASSYYRVVVDMNGVNSIAYVENGAVKNTVLGGSASVKLFGTPNDNEDKDEGVVIEVAIPKALVGLSGKTSFAVKPELANKDGEGATSDTLTGVSAFTTARWPNIVLD